MKAHTQYLQFPLEDRTMLRTATVHALTMEIGLAQIRHHSLSSRNPSVHIAILLHSPSFTCEQDRFVGRNVSLLDPGAQLQIFQLLDFSFIASLDFVGSQSVDQGAFIACSNGQVCEEHFLPLAPSSTRFHRTMVPVDEMWLVLFESYPHPSHPPGSRYLSQRLFLTSSGWDQLNSNSGPAFVHLDLQQFRVSPPALMQFGGSRPRHLDTTCIHECVTFPDRRLTCWASRSSADF